MVNGKQHSVWFVPTGMKGLPQNVLLNFRLEFPKSDPTIYLPSRISEIFRQMVSTLVTWSENERDETGPLTEDPEAREEHGNERSSAFYVSNQKSSFGLSRESNDRKWMYYNLAFRKGNTKSKWNT